MPQTNEPDFELFTAKDVIQFLEEAGSGQFEQCRNAECRLDDKEQPSFCAVGVVKERFRLAHPTLCDWGPISGGSCDARLLFWKDGEKLTDKPVLWVEIVKNVNDGPIVSYNDEEELNFGEIASALEAMYIVSEE